MKGLKRYPTKFMFLLNDQLHNQLETLAEKERRSMGEIVRMLIQAAYEQMAASRDLDSNNN